MPIIPGLLILGPVFFAAVLLLALSIASSSAVRPHQENPGLSSAFTWATDLIGALWHRIVRTTISHFAAAHLIPLARWFSGLNTLVLGLLAVNRAAVATMTVAVERLTHHTIPIAVSRGVRPVDRRARNAGAKAAGAAGAAAATHKALGKFTTHQHGLNTHYTTAVDHTFPQQLGRIRTRTNDLSRDQAKLRERTASLENGAVRTFEWIRSHPFSAVTGVFAGAVAIALTRLGYGFLRCRSWRNVGRGLTCGMGSLLSDLLALAIDVLLVADICQITQKMITVAESPVVQAALRGIVDGTEELMLCQGVKAPPALAGYWTEPPPKQTFSALPA